MKELDILLNRYLRDRWPQASDLERASFEAFLELPDPLIAAYLVAGEPVADTTLQPLVDQLRLPPA
ncbi:MAG: hypothetical protein RLZZ393_314 [Pseudomonadota bacterium]|jgi:antitoxin CptB